MPLLTADDLSGVATFIRQRGLVSLLRRLRPTRRAIVAAAWEQAAAVKKDMDAVDLIQEHIARTCTGSSHTGVLAYLTETYLSHDEPLEGLSLGSGRGSIEVEWATMCRFGSLAGIESSPKLVREANRLAASRRMKEVGFVQGDVSRATFGVDRYDVVLSWHSFHHFRGVRGIAERLCRALKPGGRLFVYEYVGPDRFQWTGTQVAEGNLMLGEIPPRYRRRWKSTACKNSVYRPGRLRMVLADPSEAVESASIVPALREFFVETKVWSLGLTLLPLVFHDIGWNFARADEEAGRIVRHCIAREQELLHNGALSSDYIIGVYTRP